MNNKKQIKQPVFAEINLTGDEFQQSSSTHMQRTVNHHYTVLPINNK